MRNRIAMLEAKLKLEKLAMKFNINLAEINQIKDKEGLIKKAIMKIKTELLVKLSDDLSADDIAKYFREIGVKFDDV